MGPVDFRGISGEPGISFKQVPEEAIDYQIRDTPAGYRPLPGWPTWQVVPDVACPWDPVVVKAMRELDPSLTPLWVTWVYAPPADQSDKTPFVTGRHAMGWHRPDLPAQNFNCLMPLSKIEGMALKRPTRLWKIYHEAENTKDRIGGFVPFSWWMYYNLLEEFSAQGQIRGVTDKPGSAFWSMREANKAKQAGIVKKQEEHANLMADMDAATAPFIEKALESMRPMDWKLWFEGGYKEVQKKKIQVGYGQMGSTPTQPRRA
jgi:hypothetical protein